MQLRLQNKGVLMIKHQTDKKCSQGNFSPLGATITSEGVNFALYSRHAREVYLLLFDDPYGLPTDVIQVNSRTRYIWHVFIHGLKPGQLYGYKTTGEYNPALGLWFNEHKLLVDPYAKALSHKARNSDNLLLTYNPCSADKPYVMDTRDNTHIVPKSIVVSDEFDWMGDERPDIPMEKLIIYEAHVKGLTAHPSSKVSHPGTYLGVIDKIPYFRNLGINAIEFLPLHEYYVDDFLIDKGLTNYWGYNTLGFFAPESSYSTGTQAGCQIGEFKTMVRELHKAGIEVILDVVYNHTCEGNEFGPTLHFRGIDNHAYYSLTGTMSTPSRYYMNYTGCGNSFNLNHPQSIRLVMDSLRYWVNEMHVDGFRFDLASVLGRVDGPFRIRSSFFDAIAQDPVLNRVKLIAEPWDLGTYEVGNFPVDWAEWNGRFRDTVRKFIKGDAGQIRDLGHRLTGSADLYADDGRSASDSINFVTCHDGFTMYDLVTYNTKHNDANREENRDGSNDNNSWNCGTEGLTDNADIMQLRKQLMKNHFCTLLFSSGTPMILGGDEFMRTQNGNNNAYCQDNAISWFNWELVATNAEMVDFVRKAIAFTRKYTILQRRKFFLGTDLDDDKIPDLSWYGSSNDKPYWDDQMLRTLCCRLDGGEEKSDMGDYSLFMILNADFQAHWIALPPCASGMKWHRIIDTSINGGEDFLDTGKEVLLDPQDLYIANQRTTVVLLEKKPADHS